MALEEMHGLMSTWLARAEEVKEFAPGAAAGVAASGASLAWSVLHTYVNIWSARIFIDTLLSMFLTRLECHTPKLFNSDMCPRPATGLPRTSTRSRSR